MTYYSVSAFINFSLSLLLGSFIFYKNPRSKINRTMFFWCLTVAFWSFFYFLWQIESNADLALLWTRLLMLGAVWAPLGFLLVVLIFLELEKKKFYRWFTRFIIVLSVIFSVFLTTPLMVSHLEPVSGFKYWPMPGLVYHFFLAMFLGVSAYSTYLAIMALRTKLPGIKRLQIKYMLFGIILSIIGGSTNYFLWYGIPIKPYGNAFASMYVILTAYAIIRYRLMDIRVAFKKTFIYAGMAIFTYGVFYLVIWVYNIFFGGVHTKNAYLASLVIAPTFVAGLYGFTKLITKIANKYFFFSLYNYQETINKLTDELSHYIDLDKIISLIVDTIKKTMQLDRAGVLLINTETNPAYYEIAKIIGFNQQNGISLVKDNFLIKYLQKNQKPLVRDELSFLSRDTNLQNEKQNFNRLFEHMKYIEASLCLPLISNKKLIGIIVLGAKISNDAYTQEDLELLNTMSNQAAIALENARLYKQVQDFSKTLQSKVDEQTKYLKELLTMKSDFLRVVNHQLNTPLSVMKGYFSMLEEGSYPTEKALPAIKSGLERISSTVADFWHAYELEGERMKMEPQPTDITEIVNRLIPEKQKMQLTRERKLIIKVKESEFKMPPVWCDYKKIAHVISNLLDNAVHYTRAGKITVSYELLDNNYLKVNIKDTGVGLAEEDKQKLFQKFSRGNNATDLQPDGSGLGLFIAKKIVEGNFGQLSYFSDGKNQGSTFSFTIPIYKNQRPNASQEKPVSRKKIMIFNKV